MSKYNARKVKTQEGTFDSMKEYHRWCELKLLQRAGKISNLKRQVRFLLLPSQKDAQTGKVIERELTYVADFVYKKGAETVVEDAKGVRTDVYKIKKKLMLYFYGIRITET